MQESASWDETSQNMFIWFDTMRLFQIILVNNLIPTWRLICTYLDKAAGCMLICTEHTASSLIKIRYYKCSFAINCEFHLLMISGHWSNNKRVICSWGIFLFDSGIMPPNLFTFE
jgi:hypothetical protein